MGNRIGIGDFAVHKQIEMCAGRRLNGRVAQDLCATLEESELYEFEAMD